MNPKKTLHHYTDIESVISILKNEELWLTNSRYTNDPTEFDFANTYVREAAKLAYQEILDDKHFEFKLNAKTQKRYIYSDSESIKNIMSELLGREEFYIFSSTCHSDRYDEENGSLQMWRTYGSKKEDYNGCALV